MTIKPLNVLSLKSGTSFENIKYAYILTDGVDIYKTFLTGQIPLSEFLRTKIALIVGKDSRNTDDKVLIDAVENDVTSFMVDVLRELISSSAQKADLIGIEGPTIAHNIEEKYTYQLGKGRKIFETFQIPVVSHFHNADLINGGQGNPIGATYYQALATNLEKPALFINIGGVTSLTYIGAFGDMLSFDCGPGNGILNEFMQKHAGIAMDYNGQSAACGTANEKIVNGLMRAEFFEKKPPKALNRDFFADKMEHFEGLSVQDGAATIVAFIAESIAVSVSTICADMPRTIFICGEGAFNPTLVRSIKQKLKQQGLTAQTTHDDIKPDDAACIAFLAARRLYNLPVTFPSTTGVSAPVTGGKIYDKDNIDEK